MILSKAGSNCGRVQENQLPLFGRHCICQWAGKWMLRGGCIYSASCVSDPGYNTQEACMHICAGNVVSLAYDTEVGVALLVVG